MNFEKAMYAEFQFLFENDTWEYINAPLGRPILTDRSVKKTDRSRFWSWKLDG